jgi:predicted dehydrogenase
MKHIAVIGAGSIGRRHIGNLRLLHTNAHIYWLGATGQIPCAQQLQDIYYPATFDELMSLPLDYCIVASPASSHQLHVAALLAHNIPVLVEKPLAATLAQGLQLQKLCQMSPQIPVAVAYCLRFLPALQLLKTQLANQVIGTVLHVNCHVAQHLPDWRPGTDYRQSVSARSALGGGVLLELSHELDYLYYLFGPLQLLHSRLQQSGLLDIDVEDQADLLLSASDTGTISLHLDFLQKTVQRRCVISGTDGRLEWDLVQNTIYMYQEKQQKLLFSDESYPRNQMYLAMLQQFELMVQQPEQQPAHLASIDDALSTLRLINKAKQQSQFKEN